MVHGSSGVEEVMRAIDYLVDSTTQAISIARWWWTSFRVPGTPLHFMYRYRSQKTRKMITKLWGLCFKGVADSRPPLNILAFKWCPSKSIMQPFITALKPRLLTTLRVNRGFKAPSFISINAIETTWWTKWKSFNLRNDVWEMMAWEGRQGERKSDRECRASHSLVSISSLFTPYLHSILTAYDTHSLPPSMQEAVFRRCFLSPSLPLMPPSSLLTSLTCAYLSGEVMRE